MKFSLFRKANSLSKKTGIDKHLTLVGKEICLKTD